MDDPLSREKGKIESELRDALQAYFDGLQARVVEAFSE